MDADLRSSRYDFRSENKLQKAAILGSGGCGSQVKAYFLAFFSLVMISSLGRRQWILWLEALRSLLRKVEVNQVDGKNYLKLSTYKTLQVQLPVSITSRHLFSTAHQRTR